MKLNVLIAGLALTIAFSACKKENEEFVSAPISDYSPLVVGKYITYKLDSMLFTSFGTSNQTVSYQIKHEVESEILDNLNRPAFLVRRYIRKTSADAWVPDNSFTAINTGTTFEFVENNMRFLKLTQPIKQDFTWKGNSYIDTYSQFSDVQYMADWDYFYDSLNVPLTLNGVVVENTIKVDQRDEVIGLPENPDSYSQKNFAVENYAKGIGLVYRYFFHSEYQPGTGSYSDGSYGIVMTMIDHN